MLDQITDKCTGGLALALACDDDGAIMELQWCNSAFTLIPGYGFDWLKRGAYSDTPEPTAPIRNRPSGISDPPGKTPRIHH